MSLFGFILLGILIVFVAFMIRSGQVVGRDPQQQIKELERAGLRFPLNMPFGERLRVLALSGIYATTPLRIWLVILILGAILIFFAIWNV
jgi:hypothetical protein